MPEPTTERGRQVVDRVSEMERDILGLSHDLASKADLNALREEFVAFRAKMDTLLSLARFATGAFLGVSALIISLTVWAIYGAGRIETQVAHLADEVKALRAAPTRPSAAVRPIRNNEPSRAGSLQ